MMIKYTPFTFFCGDIVCCRVLVFKLASIRGSSAALWLHEAAQRACGGLHSSCPQGNNYNVKRYFIRALCRALCKFEAFTTRKPDFWAAREYLTRWWGEDSQWKDKWGRSRESVLPFCVMEPAFGGWGNVLAGVAATLIHSTALYHSHVYCYPLPMCTSCSLRLPSMPR